MSFSKYETYKESGVEWLGEVPGHWNITQLKYVVHPETSITYGIVQAGPEVANGIPYIKTSDMAGDKLPLEGYARTSPEIDASYQRSKVSAGDIVVAIRATVGKCLPVPPELEGANLTQGTAKVSPGDTVLADYLLLSMKSEFAQDYFGLMSKGATFKEITLDALRRTPLAFPPLSEQTQIARFLNHETARINALIAEQERLIELLKEKRQAVISHAVTKGLDPTAPMKDSGVEWLGEVPEHWEVCRLKNISTIVDCKNRTPEYVDDGKFLVVRTSNVKEQSLNVEGDYYTDRKNFEIWTERGIPPVGSILFTREAPTGEVCLVPDDVPLCMGQRMMNIIPDETSITPFLFDFLTSDCLTRYIESQSAGSTVTHLRVEQVYNIPIVVPPTDEQIEIDSLVGEMKKQFSELMEIAHESVVLLQERRSALISAAVTGKIDVRDWKAPASDSPVATLEAAYS